MRIFAVLILALALSAAAGCDQQSGNQPIQRQSGAPIYMEQQIHDLSNILEKDPENMAALIKLGNAYFDSNRCSQAISMYMRTLKIDPANANVRVDMGTCQRRVGRPDLALEAFNKAIEYQPRHAYAHLNKGVVLSGNMNRPEEAIEAFETFLDIAPADRNSPIIREEIGKLKRSIGQ